MNDKELRDVLSRYGSETCTEEEERLINDWYALYNPDIPDPSTEEVEAAKLEVLKLLPKPDKPLKNKSQPWLKATAGIAAACALVYVGGQFLKQETVPKQETKTESLVNDVKPGSNKATLTLPNGKIIDLANAKDGELAGGEQGVKIIKTSDGHLLYQFNPDAVSAAGPLDSMRLKITGKITAAKEPGINTMMTPTGGQYEIVLPDGTTVWVNAKTILKFPSTFENKEERRVYLSGEAYFEVRQIKSVFNQKRRARKVPFIVQTNTQEITVLGTKFNINSYDNGGNIHTTLVEGSVKVASATETVTIKPGQVAINTGSEIMVRKANVELATAWKNGDFMFETENLEEIMKKVARWYDVDVVYTDRNLGSKPFSGAISKYRNISELLDILQATGEVKFKIQGKKVTVTK